MTAPTYDHLVIALGKGAIEVGQGHEGAERLPAILFGRNGAGTVGVETEGDRIMLPGECIAAITFENPESLDVVAEKLAELRARIWPSATNTPATSQQPLSIEAIAKMVMDAPLIESHGEYPYLSDDCKAMALTVANRIRSLPVLPAAPNESSPALWVLSHNGNQVVGERLKDVFLAADTLRTEAEQFAAAERLMAAIDAELAEEAACLPANPKKSEPHYGKDCPVGMVQVEFVGADPKARISDYGWKPTKTAFLDIYIDGQRYNMTLGDIGYGSKARRGIHIVTSGQLIAEQAGWNAADLYYSEQKVALPQVPAGAQS